MSIQGGIGVDLTARDLSGPAFQSMEQKLKRLQDQTQGMSAAMGAAAGPAGVLAGVFGALQLDKAVDGMIAFHKAALDQVGTYQNLADKLGINVELYQAYRLAAKSAGVGHEELNGVLGRFNAKLGDAANGQRSAIEAFRALGVNILDANGKMRQQPEILTEAARALLEVDNNARRSSIGLALFGDGGATLSPLLRSLSTGADDMTSAFQKQGLIVDGQTTATLKRLADASALADEKTKALYATIAAPIQAQGLEYVSKLTEDLTNRIRAAKGGWVEMMDTIFGGRNGNATMGGLQFDADGTGARLQKMQDMQKQIESFQNRLDKPRRGDAPAGQIESARDKVKADLAALQNEATAAERAAATLATNRAALDRLTNDGLPAKDRFKTAGASNPADDKGKGSGGGSTRDRIGENLTQLIGEREALEKALDSLRTNVGTPLREIERTVEVQKRIDDMVARMTKTDAGDKRAGEIRATATALEGARYGYQQYIRAINDAEMFETKFGDGKREQAEIERRLSEARATGRLSIEAYTHALKESAFAAEQQRLAAVGSRGGFEGMAAGFESAANAYGKQNDAFNTGARFFQDTTSLMTSSFRKWRKEGQIDMGEFLASWADMLFQMSIQAATSQLFSAAFGDAAGAAGAAGGGGWIMNLLGLGGGGSADGGFAGGGGISGGEFGAGHGDFFAAIPPFASGGRPRVGEVSLVGENGPEPFIPDTAGTILPNSVFGGGSAPVVVHQTIHVGEFVTSTEFRSGLSAMKDSAMSGAQAAILADRQRGGAFKRAFG